MLRRLAGLLLFSLILVWPQQLAAISPAGKSVESAVRQLDAWSRTELALGQAPLPPRISIQSTAARDFLSALERERPRAVALAGGARSYAGTLSLEDLKTFKGFTYEQDVLRRWNSTTGPMRYRLAAVGDPIADILETNLRTGRVRKLQLYSGGNPKVALEKMLLSDRTADKFVVPRDCYSRIRRAIEKTEDLWSRWQAGQLVLATAQVRIAAELSQAGLRWDPQTGEVYTQSAKHGRSVLGRLGTSEIDGAMKRLIRDKLTSEQIRRYQWRGLVELDPELGALAKRLGGTPAAIRGLYLLYGKLLGELRQAGEPLHRGGRLASNMVRQMAKHKNERYGRLVRHAAASGVPHDEITKVVRRAQTDRGHPMHVADKINRRLERRVKQAHRTNQLKSQAVLAAFSVVGGTVSYALSDEDLLEWLQSDNAAEWGIRSTAGFAGVHLVSRLETMLVERSLVQVGNTPTKPLLRQVLGRRVLGGGAAAALFVTGESLIAVMFYDASLAEVVDRAYEAVVVIAISRGAVFGAQLTASALGGGSLGGPLGAAVALGGAILYESAKYAWRRRSELNSQREVFAARCEVAREKVNERFVKLVSEIQALPTR